MVKNVLGKTFTVMKNDRKPPKKILVGMQRGEYHSLPEHLRRSRLQCSRDPRWKGKPVKRDAHRIWCFFRTAGEGPFETEIRISARML